MKMIMKTNFSYCRMNGYSSNRSSITYSYYSCGSLMSSYRYPCKGTALIPTFRCLCWEYSCDDNK